MLFLENLLIDFWLINFAYFCVFRMSLSYDPELYISSFCFVEYFRYYNMSMHAFYKACNDCVSFRSCPMIA